ncbi:hypothetical protein ACWDSL_06355 [Streptomyces sp. NPDC000941]
MSEDELWHRLEALEGGWIFGRDPLGVAHVVLFAHPGIGVGDGQRLRRPV